MPASNHQTPPEPTAMQHPLGANGVTTSGHGAPYWITVANLKGGVAKTTTAVYLAQAFSVDGPVLLIDADHQRSALEWADAAQLPFTCVSLPVASLHRHAAGLALAASLVIIDTPPGDEAVVASAMRSCDLLIVPIAPSTLDLTRLAITLALAEDVAALRADGMPPPLRLLLTRTRAGTRSRTEVRELFEEQGLALFDCEIPIREQIGRAGGAEIADTGPYGALADEIRTLRAAGAARGEVVA